MDALSSCIAPASAKPEAGAITHAADGCRRYRCCPDEMTFASVLPFAGKNSQDKTGPKARH